MLRLSVVSLLSVMFFSSASQSAIIVAGDLTGEEQEKVDRVLRTYTGPSPKYFEKNFEGPENSEVRTILLNNDIPFSEVEFLKDYFQKERLNVKVAYVPSTIWNLHVINKYLTDEETKQSYQNISHLSSDDKAYRTRYFSLSNELMDILKYQDERDTDFFISLSNNYLRNIEENKTKDDSKSQALISELRKIEDKAPSILHKMIAEEMEAGEKNKILLVRATEGLILKNQVNTLATLQWYEGINPQEQVLDFPLEGGNSAWESIHKFHTKLCISKEYASTKNLSYADSMLGGYLFDFGSKSASFDPDGIGESKSACSFVFYSDKPTIHLYTLHLDKSWFFSKGNDLFHAPSLETDSIFGSGENFHPRLRTIFNYPGTQHFISPTQIPVSLFKIDSYLFYGEPARLTEQQKEHIRMYQFALEANNVISQARIVSFKGEIVDSQNYSEEIVKILNKQKELSTILQEKMAIVL